MMKEYKAVEHKSPFQRAISAIQTKVYRGKPEYEADGQQYGCSLVA